MSIPVISISSDSEGDSIFGDDETFPPMIDIHIDPASLPAPTPAATIAGTIDVDTTEESEDELPAPQSPLFDHDGEPFYDSDGEWIPASSLFGHDETVPPTHVFSQDEEDPSEEDPMEEDHETEEESMEPVTSDEDEEPEEAAPVPPPYEPARFPYHSGGPRTIRTARKRVHRPQTAPTPIPTPTPAPISPPPMTDEEFARAWAEYAEAHPTTCHAASTSAAPPTLASLAEQVDAQDVRIEQLEHTVEIISGPAHVEMMQQDLWTMEQQVQHISGVTQHLSAALPTIGNERMGLIEARLGQIESLLGTLQSQISALQEKLQ